MAVTVTDKRTTVDAADATTNWTAGSNSPAVFTTGPDPMEKTGCLGQIISKTNDYMYAANGTFDCSGSGQLVLCVVVSAWRSNYNGYWWNGDCVGGWYGYSWLSLSRW